MNQKRKRKNKNKSILYLLLLLILTSIAISGTFARYTASTTGTGTAQVAAWSFAVNGLEDASLVTTDLTKSVANGRLAPGTEGEFAIEVNAYGSEVAVDYEIELLDMKNKPENLNFYADSAYTTQVVGLEKEVTNEDGTVSTETIYTITGHMTLDEVLNEDTAKRMVKMYWQWPFETAGENSDETDTLDAFKGNMEFSVKVVGSQSLEDAPEVTTYKISYDLNNGTGEIRSQIKQEGIDAVITSLVPRRTGYEFVGWATEADATQATYVAGNTFVLDENTTLYAVWQANEYTVTYNYAANGGTSVAVETEKVAYGDNVDLTPTATKSGYEFVGWSTSPSTNSTIDSLVMGKDITLYAVYKKDVTVTYDCLAETTKDTIYNNQTESRITVTNTIPEKPNFVFKNWNTKQDGTGTSYEAGSSYTSIESATLYAQWEDAVATTETTGYTTLALAMADADNGQTVTMLKDSTETATATVASGKDITLDLGGKTVQFKETNKLNNYGTLNVVGSGKITGSQTDTIYNSGTGTLNVKMNDDGIIDSTAIDLSGKAIANQGILNIDSGVVQNSAKAEDMGAAATFVIVNNGTINMNGGTIRGISADNGLQYGIWFQGTLNINGGMIETNGTAIGKKESGGNITITGGTIKVGGTNNTVSRIAIALDNGTNLEIKGDKPVHIYNKLGTAIQNSSTGAINITNPNAVIEGNNALINETTGIVTIGTDDGTVSTTSPSIIGKVNGIDMRAGTLNFYDGVISGTTAIKGTVSDWPEGYCVKTTTTDGVQKAVLDSAIATTSTRGYASLAKAMEAADTTDTVTMLADSTETETATVAAEKDITLDLGGKTVTYNGANGISNSGTLTVIGSGKVTGNQEDTIYNTGMLNINADNETSYNNGTGGIIESTSSVNKHRAIENQGTLNINSGVIANSTTGTLTTDNPYVIINGTDKVMNMNGGVIRAITTNDRLQYGIWTGGTTNISGGEIEAAGCSIYMNGNSNVTITGGTIKATKNNNAISNMGTGTLEMAADSNISISSAAGTGIHNETTGKIMVNNPNATISGTIGIFNAKEGSIEYNAGTVEGNSYGVYNEAAGTVTIGSNDETVLTTSPSITGSTYGINMKAGTLNFYDGVISGTTAIYGTVADIPEGYSIKTTTANGVETAILVAQ